MLIGLSFGYESGTYSCDHDKHDEDQRIDGDVQSKINEAVNSYSKNSCDSS